MPQYLVSVYQPDGPPSPTVDLERIRRALDVVNAEIRAAGGWVFAGGLHPPATATVLRPRGNDVLITDGPFAEGKEHLGGFTIVEAPDLDVALESGRKVARASTLPVEVRAPSLMGTDAGHRPMRRRSRTPTTPQSGHSCSDDATISPETDGSAWDECVRRAASYAERSCVCCLRRPRGPATTTRSCRLPRR